MSLAGIKSLRDRKGFALILVFSLATLVLLLGLSLVSLTQVESASSRYDQGMRVARANARLALQMAIGDLQEFAGPDQRITATADGMRTDGANPVGASFNDVTSPATNGVYQPFWTGVWDNDKTTNLPVWLVTRPLGAAYTINSGTQDADPLGSDLGVAVDLVKLVGEASAKPENPGAGQNDYDVNVPRERVSSTHIVGMDETEEVAIGHYAYWVGDNGVKANYLIEDAILDVTHDEYAIGGIATDDQTRLMQMAAHRNFLEVDSREMDASNVRLSAVASEFALRESVDAGDSLLGSLTHNDLLRRFHDTAGVSRGLLVDTVRGGLRRDLSVISPVNSGDTNTDTLVNDYLMPYLNVSSLTMTSPTELTRSYEIGAKDPAFDTDGPNPGIVPVLTGFQLRLSLSAKDLPNPVIESSSIYAQFGVSVELWNPYSSRVYGADLRLAIENLADATGITVTYYDDGNAMPNPAIVDLSDLLSNVSEFHLDTTGVFWEPGEIKVFAGAYDSGTGILSLLQGASIPSGDALDYSIPTATLPQFVSGNANYNSDQISLDGPVWTPALSLSLSGEAEPLYELDLGGVTFNELKSSPAQALGPSQPHLSYVIELRNPDVNWGGYDPRTAVVTDSMIVDDFDDPDATPVGYDPYLMDYFEYPGSSKAIDYVIQSSAIDLLGYNLNGDVEHNIPMFELPRQEFISLGALQMAEFPSSIRKHLGMSGDLGSINDVFDRFFLSSVPQAVATTWTTVDALPNSRLEPADGSAIADLQSEDSSEHLYLRGAFNINSTSVEAWASLLKGIRLGNWSYDDLSGEGGLGQEAFAGENQFLRFSQSAEETWRGTYDPNESIDDTREWMRKGLRTFLDTEIESLATAIVRGIRERRQATSGSVGPFVSLQDFIDSGVIENAIGPLGADLNNGYTDTFASSYLTQQDVLTAVAPFLSARSDTFVIRAYGDAVNPFDSEEVLARAYCEAIVQRTHAKHNTDPNSGDAMMPTGEGEGEYGRAFKVIAFRWMTGDEI